MRRRQPELPEGGVFEVPLENGRRALGMIARVAGRCVLGHYFLDRGADTNEVFMLDPREASFVQRTSTLALESGEWPIVGRVEP